MTMSHHPAQDRFHSNFGWLDSWHSFSFGNHYDPERLGYAALRVINDDLIAAGGGFGTHPHRDMEIISYPVVGGLAHKDSTGSSGVVSPGEVQVMSAGTGITHSEHAAGEGTTRLLQIWIMPDREGHSPRYDQRHFAVHEEPNVLHTLVSGDGRDASLSIHQDAIMYAAKLTAGSSLNLPVQADRKAWVQIVNGSGSLGAQQLQRGDGVAIEGEAELAMQADDELEFLLFDLS
ncbi:MAG: pirin family protein [Planctomycetota bacterium]|jgi:redox-sensitive bicupin YhaK (pirin superfamily)|nr:pirin family protein [Planctomycetota bacterium]